MFLERFLVSNLWNGGLICVMLVLKWLLRDRISLRTHYHSWYVLFVSLFVSFLPGNLLGSWTFATPVQEQAFAIGSGSNQAAEGAGWIPDTTQLVPQQDQTAVVVTIWLMGVLAFAAAYGWGGYRLQRVRRFAQEPPKELQALFAACCEKLGIKGGVQLRQSEWITSPVTFGMKTAFVVLPQKGIEDLSTAQVEHIFLHELTHIRHGDLLTNGLLCGVQAVFWFNPFVWIALGQMRRDREAYCDWDVLNGLSGEAERICYGQTILRFAAGGSTRFSAANGLCQRKDQLKYRLERIVNFRRETKWKRMAGRCLAAVLVLLSVGQIPVLAQWTEGTGEYYDPSNTISVTEGDWAALFAGVDGCAVVYDRNEDRYAVYNKEEMTRRVPPCSTYKIYSTLNALEQGIITPEDNTLSWDSKEREFAAWNRDHDLVSAMRDSVNWYFQALDRAAGADRLGAFYRSIGYGNCDIGNDVQNYWNGSALKISPLEQVELLVKLYQNDFGFDNANVAAVMDAISLEAGLFGKTGTGRLGSTNVAGWFVGFEETEGNVYFFAVYLYSEDGADGAAAEGIALAILERMKE